MVVSSNLRNRILWYISRLCSEFFEYLKEKESAKEKGHSEAVLLNIVAHLEKLDRKFDSRLTEYDTKFGSFSQGLLDTIGDTVKTTVEERLRVLGVSNSSQPESQHVMVSEDNQQPESNSGQPDGQNVMVSEDNRQPDSNSSQPASKTPIDKQSEDSQPQKTPDKGQSEKNLADDIAKADAKGMGAKLNSKVVRDKAAGVKKNLDSAFGNADATNADLVSDSPDKEPPFGRGCRGLGKRNNLATDLERNEAELKKKQKQEEAELKRKKKQEEAELKKKQKKEEAETLKSILTMSSSSFTSGNYYRRRRNTERGTPKECWCGAPSDIFTSGSETNPGRLYYCCAKGYHKSHLFKWADECLVEEVEDIKAVINGMNRDISELRVNVGRLANGVKTESERKGGECLSESRCLRNVVVCVAGMAILCYYYFSLSHSGNNASLMAIASTLDKLSSKFDLMDARFKKPLVDQKSIDDMVKVAVEERLKVMGIGKNPQNKENLSNVAADQQPEPLSSPQPNTQQKSVCSPLLAETLGKDMGPRNNLSNELDKERGMKKTLAKEFGTHAEDEGANVLDFLYVSPEKATKAEDLRRRSTRNRTIKDEDAEDKKKAVQAETVLKKKEKAAAKRKAAASMKQKQHELKKPKQVELMNEEQAELKNQEQAELMNEELAELKNQEADNEKIKNITTPRANVKRCKVEDSVEDSEFAVMTDEVLTEENEILPESPMASQELIRSAIVKEYREKTSAFT
ncbi:hypothetical protein HID58_094320 [Brassica napus]|uniref:GRF-type domain-containing protein n=1 Tax=Brassica napus TaxID=3708 RepID=A0ABQ7X7N6_BRANA|nr:hypothetical protein HID58_094320 [Brassica napus]